MDPTDGYQTARTARSEWLGWGGLRVAVLSSMLALLGGAATALPPGYGTDKVPDPPAPSASQHQAAPEKKRQRTDIDRPSGETGITAGPVMGGANKECVVKGADVVCERKGLIFRRCPFGQTWKGNACTGKPQDLARRDIFNPRTKAMLGQWRVPTVDELGGAMGYFAKSSESPFQQGVRYWTSTRAVRDKGYTLIQYAAKRTMLGTGKTGTQLVNSDDEPNGILILVRDKV